MARSLFRYAVGFWGHRASLALRFLSTLRDYFSTLFPVCQDFFSNFFKFFNPRLCEFVGLALSKSQVSRLSATRLTLGGGLSSLDTDILAHSFRFVKTFFQIF